MCAGGCEEEGVCAGGCEEVGVHDTGRKTPFQIRDISPEGLAAVQAEGEV